MFHGLAVDGIADHFRKSSNAWIFGDEAVVPAFLRRADQHQFKPALPDDAPAQPFEHRPAFPSIGRIGLGAGRSLARNCAKTSLVGSMWPMRLSGLLF